MTSYGVAFGLGGRKVAGRMLEGASERPTNVQVR